MRRSAADRFAEPYFQGDGDGWLEHPDRLGVRRPASPAPKIHLPVPGSAGGTTRGRTSS
ncbi:hypothetical protein [Streptomyces prasinus]|uniref:hypothetical protein n=1 Tax=Streptomyces prasinus TaxID=67345 RepID=UPI000ABCB944|nr:hypothetical protein [Streptomyces prasinus]